MPEKNSSQMLHKEQGLCFRIRKKMKGQPLEMQRTSSFKANKSYYLEATMKMLLKYDVFLKKMHKFKLHVSSGKVQRNF